MNAIHNIGTRTVYLLQKLAKFKNKIVGILNRYGCRELVLFKYGQESKSIVLIK